MECVVIVCVCKERDREREMSVCVCGYMDVGESNFWFSGDAIFKSKLTWTVYATLALYSLLHT